MTATDDSDIRRYAAGSEPPASGGPRPATPAENLLTLLAGTWLVVGLFIDGYAHAEIIDTETEDFFTPWHAIFYSGFLFATAVIGWIAIRRSAPGPLRGWLPPGYGYAAVGVAIFAAGGLGDGIWHTVFGVESGVDALLSPTHLLLFIGMVLILTAPLRAFWLDPTRGYIGQGDGRPAPSWSEVGGAIASMAIATALVAFFFTYAFGIGEDSGHQLPFDPVTELHETEVELGLSTAYVATMILVVPFVGLLRRTDLPQGGLVVLWLVPVLLQNLAFGENIVTATLSAIAGGISAELALAVLRNRIGRRRAIIFSVGLGVGTLWSVWMAITHVTQGVGWPPELWSGQIIMATVVALGLAILAFPAPIPAPSVGGEPELADNR